MGFEAIGATLLDLGAGDAAATIGLDTAAATIGTDAAVSAGMGDMLGASMLGTGAADTTAGVLASSGGFGGVADGLVAAGTGGAAAGATSGLPDWLSNITTNQVLQGASAVSGLSQASSLAGKANATDPFASYRPQFAQQLQALMANPNSVTSLPGYQFGMDQALGGLTKNLASQGLTGSGTAAKAISDTGASYAGSFFQQQLQNLMGLSGANMNNAATKLDGNVSASILQNQSLNNLQKALPNLSLGSIFGGSPPPGS
jgi:hypothetical protein